MLLSDLTTLPFKIYSFQLWAGYASDEITSRKYNFIDQKHSGCSLCSGSTCHHPGVLHTVGRPALMAPSAPLWAGLSLGGCTGWFLSLPPTQPPLPPASLDHLLLLFQNSVWEAAPLGSPSSLFSKHPAGWASSVTQACQMSFCAGCLSLLPDWATLEDVTGSWSLLCPHCFHKYNKTCA